MEFDGQTILGGIALIMGIYASVIYFIAVVRKKSRPHLFTWLVWSILAWIGFIAQLSDNAGAGSWALGITAIFCSVTTILSLKLGTKDHTKSDWIWLTLSLSAIIPWLLTKDPFLSVLMICFIDGIAIIPTMRKSWNDPWGENLQSYAVHAIKFLLATFALANLTFITAAYPLAIVLVNSSLIALCLYRRRFIAKPI